MKDFSELFKNKRINYLQFQFTSILGEFKGVDFPVKIWEDMKDGTGIDGSIKKIICRSRNFRLNFS